MVRFLRSYLHTLFMTLYVTFALLGLVFSLCVGAGLIAGGIYLIAVGHVLYGVLSFIVFIVLLALAITLFGEV